MTFPKADLVQKYTGARFIPPASSAVHRRESGRGFAMPHGHVSHTMPQLESSDKQNPRPLGSRALPLPCGGPWGDIVGCLCQKPCISAVCSHRSERVPAEARVLAWHLGQLLALGTTRPCCGRSCGAERGRGMTGGCHEAVPAWAPALGRQCQQRSCSTSTPSQSPQHHGGTSHPSHGDRDASAQAGIAPTCCTPQPEPREPARARARL